MMGANNSTRKLTLVNDEKAGVIKLSESLAHRLRGQLDREKSQEKEVMHPSASPSLPALSKIPSPPEQIQIRPPTNEVIEEELPKIPAETELPNAPEYNVPPWSSYARDAHLFASRLREEKDAELRLKDDEWQDKFKQREQEFVDMGKLTQTHMNEAMKEVELLFRKVSCTPVCQDQQEHVMNCYQKNASQSLRCSSEVETFARCVDLNRLESFTKGRTV